MFWSSQIWHDVDLNRSQNSIGTYKAPKTSMQTKTNPNSTRPSLSTCTHNASRKPLASRRLILDVLLPERCYEPPRQKTGGKEPGVFLKVRIWSRFRIFGGSGALGGRKEALQWRS